MQCQSPNTNATLTDSLQPILLTNLFSHDSHTQHSCKIQSVDFQMGLVILTNYFKLVKRRCLFRLRRKTIPQHSTTVLKTSFKIVCFRFWKC